MLTMGQKISGKFFWQGEIEYVIDCFDKLFILDAVILGPCQVKAGQNDERPIRGGFCGFLWYVLVVNTFSTRSDKPFSGDLCLKITLGVIASLIKKGQ
jgi:hypothetical protein